MVNTKIDGYKTISHMLFEEIQKNSTPSNILIFGCGESPLPIFSRFIFRSSEITGYDINKIKIESMNKRKKYKKLNINFTYKKPKEKYDLVLSIAAFHENPKLVSQEMIDLTNEGGLIGFIDYDMKKMLKRDFFNRWGYDIFEKRELEEIGKQKAHILHTSTGLEECEEIMQEGGIEKKFSRGKLKSRWSLGPKPTKHFLYLGQK